MTARLRVHPHKKQAKQCPQRKIGATQRPAAAPIVGNKSESRTACFGATASRNPGCDHAPR
jgi:hypothetical protein